MACRIKMDGGHNSQNSREAKAAEPISEEEFRQLVDAVPQHIVVLSGAGRRLYANQIVLDYRYLLKAKN